MEKVGIDNKKGKYISSGVVTPKAEHGNRPD